jgi:hypothetical protein
MVVDAPPRRVESGRDHDRRSLRASGANDFEEENE